MLLSKNEFLEIKPIFVQQVLEKLRLFAEREAKLMFREYRHHNEQRALPNISTDISAAINRTTDALHIALASENISADEYEHLYPILKDFLPSELVLTSWTHIKERIPDTYIRNLLSTILASELVYREGVEYVNSISDKQLSAVAISYLTERQTVEQLTKKIICGEDLSPVEAQKVAAILEYGGTRTAIEFGGMQEL